MGDHESHDHRSHDHAHAAGSGHAHAHDHAHELRATPARRLSIALALTASFMVAEVVAGWLSNSLALLSDAGHMLTDAGALALALVAQAIATRGRSGRRTFGYRRAEILAALANGVVLAASSSWIVVEAVRRFRAPPEVQGLPMLGVAVLGLVVNLASAAVLSRGGGHSNPNVRAAAAHVLADAVGSVGAIIAGLLVWRFGWNRADPAISIAISLLILWSAWRLVRDALHVLMEGAPAGVDIAEVERTIASTPGVGAIHDLHVWAISEGFPIVTVHVVLDGIAHGTDVSARVAQRIREAHGIEHVTVQPEAPAAPLLPAANLVRGASRRKRGDVER